MAFLEAPTEINWIDQVLHALMGVLVTAVAILFIGWPWYASLTVTMVIAVIREQAQHPGVCHAGCRTDLLGWLLGSLLAVATILIVRGV
jgi:hypothetical protein